MNSKWVSEGDEAPNAWMLPLLLVVMGAAEVYIGTWGIIDGAITTHGLDDARNITSVTTTTGWQARLLSVVVIIGGFSWLSLSYLAPRSLEAKRKRSSYFALPPAQRLSLIVTLAVWILSKAYVAYATFPA